MPQIPFTGLQGEAAAGTIGVGVPDDYQHLTVTGDTFGAQIGQADKGLGATLEQAGGAALDVATRQKAFVDKGTVTAARIQAQQAAMDVQYNTSDDPTRKGYYDLSGSQAMGAFKPSMDAVNASYQAARDGLENDVQRALFDRETRGIQMETLAKMGQHNAAQQRVFGVQTQQGLIATSQQAAEHAYADDSQFQSSLNDTVRAQQTSDAMQGLPPELAAANTAAITSQTWGKRVLRAAADNPGTAMALLKQAGDSIDAATQTQLIQHIAPLLDKQNGQQSSAAGVAAASGGSVPSSGSGYMVPASPKASNPIAPEARPAMLAAAVAGTPVPAELLGAQVQQESQWDAGARGKAGDRGLTQVLDSTARDPGFGMSGVSPDALNDPAANLRFGAQYLYARGKAAGLTDADWRNPAKVAVALKAYNGGGDPNYAQNVMRNLPAAGLGGGASQVAAGPKPLAIGDSLAQGIQAANGTAGGGTVGASPDQVLDNVNALPTGMSGQSVILSSGISNDPTKLTVVQQQLDSLKARGANVTLVGVGDRPDLAPLNDQLSQMAAKNGATFAPIQAGPDGVHPVNYAGVGIKGAAPAPQSPMPAPGQTAAGLPPLFDLNTALQATDDYADAHNFSAAAKEQGENGVYRQHARLNQLWSTERSALKQNVSDLLPALGQGLDVQIPEARIRAAFPGDQGDRMMDELHIQQGAGQVMKSIQFMPYDQALQTVNQLQVPGTVQSGRIMLRGGALSGPGVTGQPASGTDPALAGSAVKMPESPTDMRMRLQVAQAVQGQLVQRQKAIAADPAGYAALQPDVRALQAKIDPADPQTMQDYANASLTLQQKLGVPEGATRLLTKAQSDALAARITTQDPAHADTAAQLDGLAQTYGDNWPKVFDQMVSDSGLPHRYQVLAAMDAPGQVLPRQDVQRAFAFEAQKGGPKELMAALPQGTERTLRENIDPAMEPFRATTRDSQGGLRLFSDVQGTAMTLAAYRIATGKETDPAQAVRNAAFDLIGQKYDLSGSMRVPKLYDGQPLGMATAVRATNVAKSGLTVDDVSPQTSSNPALTPADTKVQYLREIKSQGYWAPNRDDSGLVLMMPATNRWDRTQSMPQVVLGADGRTPLTLKFSDMVRVAGGHVELPDPDLPPSLQVMP